MTRDPVSRHWDTTVDRCDDQLRYLGGPPKALSGVDHTSATLHPAERAGGLPGGSLR
jgi:hypothetical protein